MKKLMILGGSVYIIPVIEKAHELGLYVITCDYLPHNAAHRYSDEYINVSIIDKEATLAAAREHHIDGVISFACDPGVVTAAYIAEELGLPFQGSYESVRILQDKGLFRQFLTDHGFNTPHARQYTDKNAPLQDLDYFTWPVIVKPVDSAGSKGVTKVERPEDLDEAIDVAIEGSHGGAFIIEDFITFGSHHSSADPFTTDGQLAFVSYSDQLFDREADNPYTPAYIIWPSTMKQGDQDYLTDETQRLMDLLGMGTGIYNIETVVGADGKPYIMEVSPRGGGCKIAELQDLAYGTHLIENEIRKAVGMSLVEPQVSQLQGCWCEMVVHARPGQSGILQEVHIDDTVMRDHVKLLALSARPGDMVEPFTGANKSLGDLFLHTDTREEMMQLIENDEKWLQIRLVEM